MSLIKARVMMIVDWWAQKCAWSWKWIHSTSSLLHLYPSQQPCGKILVYKEAHTMMLMGEGN